MWMTTRRSIITTPLTLTARNSLNYTVLTGQLMGNCWPNSSRTQSGKALVATGDGGRDCRSQLEVINQRLVEDFDAERRQWLQSQRQLLKTLRFMATELIRRYERQLKTMTDGVDGQRQTYSGSIESLSKALDPLSDELEAGLRAAKDARQELAQLMAAVVDDDQWLDTSNCGGDEFARNNRRPVLPECLEWPRVLSIVSSLPDCPDLFAYFDHILADIQTTQTMTATKVDVITDTGSDEPLANSSQSTIKTEISSMFGDKDTNLSVNNNQTLSPPVIQPLSESTTALVAAADESTESYYSKCRKCPPKSPPNSFRTPKTVPFVLVKPESPNKRPVRVTPAAAAVATTAVATIVPNRAQMKLLERLKPIYTLLSDEVLIDCMAKTKDELIRTGVNANGFTGLKVSDIISRISSYIDKNVLKISNLTVTETLPTASTTGGGNEPSKRICNLCGDQCVGH